MANIPGGATTIGAIFLLNFYQMPYYTYVIFSKSSGRYYKGYCRDLQTRLIEHNSGKTKSIKAFLPWEIVYFEEFPTADEAIKREKYFKSAVGRMKEEVENIYLSL